MLIPPLGRSASLRVSFLLRLTGEVLDAIPAYPYPTDSDAIRQLATYLGELDNAWLAILQMQLWK
jgi:hypothetical protein